MPLTFKEMMELPDRERSKVLNYIKPRKIKRPRGDRRKDKGKTFTRDELIEFAKLHNIRLCKDVEEKRSYNEPTINDYINEFGNWGNAKKEIYPEEAIKLGMDVTPEYLIKTIVELNIWSYREYCNKRKKHPDIIPSTTIIFKKFGSWGKIKAMAKRYSMKITMEEYCKMARKLGRVPRWGECRRNGLEIFDAAQYFGSKQKMDKFLVETGLLSSKLCQAKKK